MLARYLTHPQVLIDEATPIQDWALSSQGRDRVMKLADANPWPQTGRIISSRERKAVETARILAEAWDCSLELRDNQHENDRSSTGFLPRQQFEAAADQFFASPDDSFRGWETARAAQHRIVSEVNHCLSQPVGHDTLFVGHGAVGTLLYCALSKHEIDRNFDQVDGGGNWFAFSAVDLKPLHGWRPLEDCLSRVLPITPAGVYPKHKR